MALLGTLTPYQLMPNGVNMPPVSKLPTSTLPSSGWIRQKQLIPAVVPFSATTLWRKCREGTFPKPVKLSPYITAWRVSDVDEYLKQCES